MHTNGEMKSYGKFKDRQRDEYTNRYIKVYRYRSAITKTEKENDWHEILSGQ